MAEIQRLTLIEPATIFLDHYRRPTIAVSPLSEMLAVMLTFGATISQLTPTGSC
jgi:hypothetical protein